MVNYACAISQSETEKYFECIITALMLVGPKRNNSNQT